MFLRKWFEENSCYPNCAAINIFSFKDSYEHNHFNGDRIINSFHSTLANSFRQVSIMSCVRQNVIYLLDIPRQALVGLCREAITGKLLSRRGRNRRGKQALGGSVEHNRFFDGVGVGQRPKNQRSALERGGGREKRGRKREREGERVVVCGTASARNICITIVRRSPPYRRHTHSWIMHTPSTEPPVCTPHSERGPSARVAMCTPHWEPPASNPRFYREGCLRRSLNTTQCSRSRDTNASRRRITCVFISVKAYLRCAHVHYIVVSRRSLSPFCRSNFSILFFFSSHFPLVSREDISQPEYIITRLKYISRGHKFPSFSSFSFHIKTRGKMVPRLIYSFHKRCAQKIGVKEIPW